VTPLVLEKHHDNLGKVGGVLHPDVLLLQKREKRVEQVLVLEYRLVDARNAVVEDLTADVGKARGRRSLLHVVRPVKHVMEQRLDGVASGQHTNELLVQKATLLENVILLEQFECERLIRLEQLIELGRAPKRREEQVIHGSSLC